MISAAVLNSAYRNARDADVRERILLITRVRLDKNEASSVAEKLDSKIMSEHSAKEYAIMLCKPHRQSTKSIASTSLLFNLVDGNQELPARREHIRERLPGELAEINKSDGSDILQSMV